MHFLSLVDVQFIHHLRNQWSPLPLSPLFSLTSTLLTSAFFFPPTPVICSFPFIWIDDATLKRSIKIKDKLLDEWLILKINAVSYYQQPENEHITSYHASYINNLWLYLCKVKFSKRSTFLRAKKPKMKYVNINWTIFTRKSFMLFEKTELTHSFLALTFRWYLLYCFNSKGKNILLYDILILQQLFSNHCNCYITTTPTTTPTATTILLLY